MGLTRSVPGTRGQGEGELVAASRSGDLEAFGELVRRHERRALGLALRLLSDRHEAEDAVQEAFLRAWRALGSFEPGRDFDRWLLKIAANAALDLVRRRRPEPVPAENLEALPLARPEGGIDPESADARAVALEQALCALPGRQRLAFVLFHQAGLSYEEIAARLGAPVGTVRSSLHRARLALRSALTGRDLLPTAERAEFAE